MILRVISYTYIYIYTLGLQVPSEKVFGVGLEGPNTF